MKDLITVFAYCPDDRRKRILQDLLFSLQSLRKKYKVLVVSHSTISDLSYNLCDFFYLDNHNELLTDFDLTNKFWFRGGRYIVNSSLVYPYSTHLAIYRLLYYTINFSKSMGFEKVHFLEYDVNLEKIDLIDRVNEKLDSYDNVMFNTEDGWNMGVYFASKMENFRLGEFFLNREKILEELKNVENRMTENVTPKILSQNNRTIFFEKIQEINSIGPYQKNDEHLNYSLTWCVPVCSDDDKINLFIYNEKGGNYLVDFFIDDQHLKVFTTSAGEWKIFPVGNLNEISKIEIFVNKELRNRIFLDENNRKIFKDNNNFKILTNE